MTTSKHFTMEEKKAIVTVFSTIEGEDARMVALNMMGVKGHSYKGMGNFYRRLRKSAGVTSPRCRYSEGERKAIMRIFTELDTAAERKAVFAMLDCFRDRSYNSLYQQYSIMSRGMKRQRSTDDVECGTAKRQHVEPIIAAN